MIEQTSKNEALYLDLFFFSTFRSLGVTTALLGLDLFLVLKPPLA